MAQRTMPCPHCGRLIDGTQARCAWCGAARHGLLARWSASLGDVMQGEWLLTAVIAANVAFYLLSLLLSKHRGLDANPLNFLSPDQTSLLILGATGFIPVVKLGRFWTLVSASYLHGGLLHIFLNMMALRQVGPWVISEFGAGRMFVIYTLSGVSGYLASCLAGVPLTIGASASVCGLIGALFYFGKSRGGSYGAAVTREVSGWLVSLVVFGLVMPGINNWGHGGGLLGGVLLAKLLGYRESGAETAGHRMLALACLLATAAILLMAARLAIVYRFR